MVVNSALAIHTAMGEYASAKMEHELLGVNAYHQHRGYLDLVSTVKCAQEVAFAMGEFVNAPKERELKIMRV